MPPPSFMTTSAHCFTNPYPSLNQNATQRFPFCARLRRNLLFTLKCVNRSDPCVRSSSKDPCLSFSCLAVAVTTDRVADRVQRLALEFGSLPEPIDRVKQLLHYAALLPPFDQESRVPANRVTGCTTQVWLDSKLDEFGRVRFRADSDSEITKGFISCLVWLLDGAEPAEVLAGNPEDLAAMNVGLYGKAHSRVNTWHNVLISMQKRVKGLLEEREGTTSLEPFPPLIAAADLTARYAKAQFYLLVVADTTLKKEEHGLQYVIILGMDLFSENMYAILGWARFNKGGCHPFLNGVNNISFGVVPNLTWFLNRIMGDYSLNQTEGKLYA